MSIHNNAAEEIRARGMAWVVFVLRLQPPEASRREKMLVMSDFIPKPGGAKIGGLGPKAQKLQALREKMAQQKSGDKSFSSSAGNSGKAKASSGPTKKTSFQRKAT